MRLRDGFSVHRKENSYDPTHSHRILIAALALSAAVPGRCGGGVPPPRTPEECINTSAGECGDLMATTIVTPDQDAIVSEIDIKAPVDRVFKGICDAETVRRRTPNLDVFEMDLRVGGKWRLEIRMPKPYQGADVIRHDGEVLEIDPPRLLVYTWFANFHDDPKHRSIVRWELTPTKSGTHVKLTHSGLAGEPRACKEYAGGWPGVLQELKTFAEK